MALGKSLTVRISPCSLCVFPRRTFTSEKIIEQPRLLDIKSAGDYLSVTLPFMRRMVRERRIAFHHVGGYVMFSPADLDRFIAAGRVPANGSK
ncbi:MAG: helix-turn-helix domain-containing protein [Actinomycetota bacterium]